MNHRFDANLIVFLNAIAETGNAGPICKFATRAENVFFLVWAEKVGPVFIPKSDMMQNCAGNGVARRIDECGDDKRATSQLEESSM